jgi:antitoxin HicB
MHYPIRIQKDSNSTFLVTFPDFPEAATFGDDRADARRRAVDALETAIQGRIADREEIPEPSTGREVIELPTQAAVKVEVYRRMRERQISKARLARLLGRHRPEIDRLLDLRHATRLDLIDEAMSAMGARLSLRVEEKAAG